MESFPTMMKLTAAEFDGLVEAALEKIPRRFRRRMQNLALVVEQDPPRPGLLGLYRGRPLPSRSVFEGFALPDQIVIFQGTHERLARDREHLARMVDDTVWHEIAHYFGMNEARVRQAEQRRRFSRFSKNPPI